MAATTTIMITALPTIIFFDLSMGAAKFFESSVTSTE
jgi:hypothetical protein